MKFCKRSKGLFLNRQFIWANKLDKVKTALQWVWHGICHQEFKLKKKNLLFLPKISLQWCPFRREHNRSGPWDSRWSSSPNRSYRTVVILDNLLNWFQIHLTIWFVENVEDGVALLFDPDLTTATGFILFISSFINILTNFSFFSSVVLSISHHSLFFSHRVMLLTPLAPVAAHPGSHCKTQATQRHCNNTVSVWPGFYFTVDSHCYNPLLSPLPLFACVSSRFVWRRIWLCPQPGCLSCS